MNYEAGRTEWLFPDLGDELPARSDAKVLVLTVGGICIPDHWRGDAYQIAWARLPERNRAKEALVAQARSRSAEALQRVETQHQDRDRSDEGARHPQSASP